MILGPILILVAIGAIIALLATHMRKKSKALREIKAIMENHGSNCAARYGAIVSELDRAGYRPGNATPTCPCTKSDEKIA